MPEHQHNHPHHHSAVERAGHQSEPTEPAEPAEPAEPYPYVYSKDPMDGRRFLRPGEPYGPASAHGPSSWVLWLLGALLARIIGAGLITAILSH